MYVISTSYKMSYFLGDETAEAITPIFVFGDMEKIYMPTEKEVEFYQRSSLGEYLCIDLD